MQPEVALAGLLDRLAECRQQLQALDPAGLEAAAAARIADELAALEATRRAGGERVPQASTAEPDTLRSLLSLARADLAVQLDTDIDAGELLNRITELAVRLIPGAEHAGISLIGANGKIATLAASSTVPASCDQLQQEAGEGPAFVPSPAHQPLRADDLGADTRWPQFAAVAAELGVRSMLTCELPTVRGGNVLLSVYATHSHAFDTGAELVVPVFASRAAIALGHAEQVGNLRRAIDSRQLVGQAVGILMERHRLTPEQAFDRLVAVSQLHHVKLRDVAAKA